MYTSIWQVENKYKGHILCISWEFENWEKLRKLGSHSGTLKQETDLMLLVFYNKHTDEESFSLKKKLENHIQTKSIKVYILAHITKSPASYIYTLIQILKNVARTQFLLMFLNFAFSLLNLCLAVFLFTIPS
jgi:hypothetical protein